VPNRRVSNRPDAADNPACFDPTAEQKAVPASADVTHQTSVWLTPEEAAQYLNIKRRTLLLWTRQGKVKGHRLSGTRRHVWRYRYADLDAMLAVPSVALPKRRDT
jgi:excisionase family DNA binding protein